VKESHSKEGQEKRPEGYPGNAQEGSEKETLGPSSAQGILRSQRQALFLDKGREKAWLPPQRGVEEEKKIRRVTGFQKGENSSNSYSKVGEANCLRRGGPE